MTFITLAVIVVGILFGIMSFIRFEPNQVYMPSTEKNTFLNTSSQSSEIPSSNSGSSNPLETQNSNDKITSSILATHNTKEDCWVGYKGKAYDITSFIPNHPGGENAIAKNCGTSAEFENAFTKKHGTSKAPMFMKVTIYKGDLI